ncbi:MAG: phosphopyruvate hydratase [Candidatus Doudnabacteria bacterium RIFCSPHIGHO2_01_FULL_46_14]|uniref:Enolase n=1 Tax=Candidatus Doudnabacteria bacterium RIFCSPHIGHO2_01_FULL_46_14 TaxID=1817824 RepID=A0A1F5NMR2_9BACT|nr:MAG: phosphopyruvate hydratase [Candidatus Doudnabacteria bacterium RIFCSPHIGHO2_01_FULL_46_14]
MTQIKNILAREILDSRGHPTVEVDLLLEDGAFGRAAVPSGASTGTHEAHDLRDGGVRYLGRGVETAVNNVNSTIRQAIIGRDFNQRSLDDTLIALDNSKNKSTLGANAILGVSLAFAKAAAQSQGLNLYKYFANLSQNEKLVLPVPMMNVLNGGRHAERSTDLQEFMIMPVGASSFREALRWGAETFHHLKKILSQMGHPTGVGDEGGFDVPLNANEEAIKLIIEAIINAGYTPGKDIVLAIDAAASEFYQDGQYRLASENKVYTNKELIDLYGSWLDKYPIVSIEDGLAEDDWDGYKLFTKKLGARLQIVGDDLFVTNKTHLQRGIDEQSANSILIKLNQIGTLSETIDTVDHAHKNNFSTIISHRSGETEDTTIADLAVGLGTGQIKTGSLSRSERMAKYNQLLRIEEELGNRAHFPGRNIFRF